MPEQSGKNLQPVVAERMVEFKNVNLTINGKKLIDDLSFQITGPGKTVVMGANGAGKSLLMRLISGLLQPDNGEITCWSGSEKSPRPVRMSMVFQKPVLLRRTAFANIAYVLKQQNLPKQHLSQIVNDALDMAQLGRHAQTPARKLSGGEQQRLALVRGLVVKPDILLLDEATANLDPASTFIVEQLVDKASQGGAKVLFVTHDVRQAKRTADDILFLHEGRNLAHQPAEQFFENPGSREAQAYLDGRLPG